MRRCIWLVCLAVLGRPAPVSAQQTPEALVSYDLSFYAAGVDPVAGQPTQTTNYPLAAVTCGQSRVNPPGGTVPNPTAVRLADPANPALDCVIVLNQAQTIFSVPVGAYLATVQAKGATLTSARSAASNPFSRVVIPVAPPVPANIRLVP